MGPEGSLPCSQEPATGSCPEPDASSPHFPTLFPKIHSNIIFPSTPRSSEWQKLQKKKIKKVYTVRLSTTHHWNDLW
jgi:hypothetical protein